MVRLFLKEVWDLPAALLSALRFQAEPRREDAFPNGAGDREQNEPYTWTGQRASWDEVLLGVIPFLLFGLAYLLKAVAELWQYHGVMLKYINYAPLAVYFISAIGLLIGWVRGFPRWSYAYLGMVLYFGWDYSNGRFYGVVYGWRAWIPLIVVALVALLITRSLRPLTRLIQGTWNDWTRLSFALYAFCLPFLTVVFLDMEWGTNELFGLVFDTLLLAAGAIVFLRSRTIWQRVVSLQAAMFILVFKYFSGAPLAATIRNPDPLSIIFLLLIFFGLMFVPGLLGLLRRGVSSLSTR